MNLKKHKKQLGGAQPPFLCRRHWEDSASILGTRGEFKRERGIINLQNDIINLFINKIPVKKIINLITRRGFFNNCEGT
jgi:hypothetical protein